MQELSLEIAMITGDSEEVASWVAKELGVPVKVIKDALDFRLKSKGNPSYTGQVISALRNQFGGHHVRKVSME